MDHTLWFVLYVLYRCTFKSVEQLGEVLYHAWWWLVPTGTIFKFSEMKTYFLAK